MIIIPAIDLKGGECVRLIKGKFDTAHKVAVSAVETALSFEKDGAGWLHMVDLDGALYGEAKNRDIILNTVKSLKIPVQVGGGIRSIKVIRDYLENGVSRVILGSAALKNKELVKEAVRKYPEMIAVGIDAKNEMVSIDGWTNTSDINYIDFAKVMEDFGVKYIIFTDISRDGTLTGPNLFQLEKLKESVSVNIIASGGIRDINNIRDLIRLDVYGAICGKSVYEGTLSLKEAVLLSNKEVI